MQDFLYKKIFENTVESYLVILATILFALFVKRFVSKYFARVIYKLVSKTGKTLHKEAFVNLIIPPLELFLLLFISFVALDKLKFPSELDFRVYKVTLFQIIDSISNAALIIVCIWLCLRIIDFVALILEEKASQTKDLTDNQLIFFFKDFFKVILVLLGVLLILKFSFNRDISGLLTGLSLVGAAIALATKESIENLIASFIIFVDKPFITGDLVKVQSFSGTIEKIGLRSTRIRADNKTYITVPNKQMVDSIVDNISLRTQRRAELRLELSLSTGTDQLKQLLIALRNEMQQKKGVESFLVNLVDTGRNAHIVSVVYFTTMPQDYHVFTSLCEEINLKAIELLHQLNIDLASASTEVVVKNQ